MKVKLQVGFIAERGFHVPVTHPGCTQLVLQKDQDTHLSSQVERPDEISGGLTEVGDNRLGSYRQRENTKIEDWCAVIYCCDWVSSVAAVLSPSLIASSGQI